MAGSGLTYRLRRRVGEGRTYCAALLAVPLIAMQIEPMFPPPVADHVVAREVIVLATPAKIWPLLRGIPDVRAGEGRWNLTQDVIGVPRPIGARLVGDGIGADRLAEWGRNIRFRERIVEWQPGRRIGWTFLFDDVAGWEFTDAHLMPNSSYLRIVSGGYTVTPLGPGRTRVTLNTRYRARTLLNGYAALWGELFLGDLENNLLAVVKARAEAPRG